MVKHGIELDSPAVLDFCRKWRVKELTAFGSILRDDFGPTSDIDFIIEWEADVPWDVCDHFAMEEELQNLLGRKVELLSRYALENSPNYLFRKSVLAKTEPVYAR